MYKSSYRNAMRVTRTETNMAYRRADHDRWQRLDFVLGQHIEPSRQHPKEDICDTLAGDYPKDFIFEGWHPQCMCVCTPILATEEQMQAEMDAVLSGDDGYQPEYKQIEEYPEGFQQFVDDNADDIEESYNSGTAPYFIQSNPDIIEDALNGELPVEGREAEAKQEEVKEKEEIKEEKPSEEDNALKAAKEALAAAAKYDDLDTTALEALLNSDNPDTDKLKEETEKALHRADIFQKAEERHKARTPEQIQAIKDARKLPFQFRPGSKYLRGEDYTFSKDFFELADPKKPISLTVGKNGGSYSSFKGDSVYIADNNRNDVSPWHRKSVIYHEYGHCIDAQRDLWQDSALRDMRNKHKKWLKEDSGEVSGDRHLTNAEYLDKTFKRLQYDMAEFLDMGMKWGDIDEQALAASDTLKSLHPKYGEGHSTKYFSGKRMKETEYLAHAFENAFVGNEVAKKYMPEIYEDMVNYVKALKKAQKP